MYIETDQNVFPGDGACVIDIDLPPFIYLSCQTSLADVDFAAWTLIQKCVVQNQRPQSGMVSQFGKQASKHVLYPSIHYSRRARSKPEASIQACILTTVFSRRRRQPYGARRPSAATHGPLRRRCTASSSRRVFRLMPQYRERDECR